MDTIKIDTIWCFLDELQDRHSKIWTANHQTVLDESDAALQTKNPHDIERVRLAFKMLWQTMEDTIDKNLIDTVYRPLLNLAGNPWFLEGVGYIDLTPDMQITIPGHSDEDSVKLKKLVNDIWYDYKSEASYISTVKLDYSTVYTGFHLHRCSQTGRLTLKLGDYFHSFETMQKKYGGIPNHMPYSISLNMKLTKEQEKNLRSALELFASRPSSDALNNL